MEESPSKIDIVIADDQAIFREGLRKLLEAEPWLRIVGEAADAKETVRLVRQHNPQILLLDLALSKARGIEALRELSKLGLPTRTIILTEAIESDQAVEVLRLGARGIIMKHSAVELLLKSIRCVNDGEFWLGHERLLDLIQAVRRMTPYPSDSGDKRDFGLTSREMQVIKLISSGYTNKDLAKELSISENTAKHHITNIFDKLGVSNRMELVLFALEHRLISED
ncbi:MAG: response regulator transcription factor [Terriglobia bacterium]|jgi:DNA-binding NarL/FixJ family response regulator